MMGFDSATSSFLALLLNKSYRTEKRKIINENFTHRSKKVQNQFLSPKFCQVTHLKIPLARKGC